MKTKVVNWVKATLFGCAVFLLPGCDRSDEPVSTGDAEFVITDAPSDDAEVKGVFVTVADIKVDGKSISGFSRQTIDLKAYQEGNTKLLATSKLTAKQYSSMVLVLDTDTDADGNQPGSYVLTQSNVKYKLKSGGSIDVNVNKSWNVAANLKSTIVIDFDLRKSIKKMDDPAVRYNFVSEGNLASAIKVTNKSVTGTLSGSYTEQTNSDADKIIVFAYKKGTYDANVEGHPYGEDGILFANAAGSAEVKGGLTSKSYTIALLEEGEYELHFAAYKLNNSTQQYEFESTLESETTSSGSAGNVITVQGGITTTISTTITGI